jgi:hypothetical protein
MLFRVSGSAACEPEATDATGCARDHVDTRTFAVAVPATASAMRGQVAGTE